MHRDYPQCGLKRTDSHFGVALVLVCLLSLVFPSRAQQLRVTQQGESHLDLELRGADGYEYGLERSLDLKDWSWDGQRVVTTSNQAQTVRAVVDGSPLITFLRARQLKGRGPRVRVSVQATSGSSAPLHYRWRSTDGVIQDRDQPATDWLLPAGPGLHFAYVLVFDNRGGYTERRIAVNTDSFGIPIDRPAAREIGRQTVADLVRHSFYFPFSDPIRPMFVREIDSGKPSAAVKADARGFVTLSDLPASLFDIPCDVFQDGITSTNACQGNSGSPIDLRYESLAGLGWLKFTARPRRISDYPSPLTFRAQLADGSSAGFQNDFFGVTSRTVLTLLDAQDQQIGEAIPGFTSGEWGNVYFPQGAPTNCVRLRLALEGCSPVVLPFEGNLTLYQFVIPETGRPLVQGMKAEINGVDRGIFLPPLSGFPSDHAAQGNSDSRPTPYREPQDVFLATKGIDSRESAWSYYRAIGAIESFDPVSGKPHGAISFEDWQRAVGMGNHVRPGGREVTARFVNRVDLNLTRVHHSISYGSNAVAAYVSNHLGPASELPADIDQAVTNAIAGRNLVARVAMDCTLVDTPAGRRPVTRFLIFSPNGELLPSINLDGRGEKFVPGVCVACHGGDRYAGSFPLDGTGSADIGAHFLPYDPANFAFATGPGLDRRSQAADIRQLNFNALDANPTQAVRELVTGWYAAGGEDADDHYLPASYTGAHPDVIKFYRNVYAPFCRTCHVALSSSSNFDNHENLATGVGPYDYRPGWVRIMDLMGDKYYSAIMPNSLRTFDLFSEKTDNYEDVMAMYRYFRNQ